MFNLFVSKNVRKILKRKDSDAGEKGIIFVGYWCILLNLIGKGYFLWLFLFNIGALG